MRILLLVVGLLISTLLYAEDKIETIQLNHRLAIELLPEVQAFLPPTATVRAFNNFIILKAESTVINDIKQLLNQLDTPLQRLKISVLKTDEILSEQQKSQTSAEVVASDKEISGSVSVQRWSTQNTRNKEQYYHAQGIAGRPIIITMGQAIPQKEQYLILQPNGGIAIQSNTYYLNIDNGFQAIARILPNNQATVDIHPTFSHFSNQSGVIEQSDVISSISGPAGTWLELGQIDDEKNIEKQGSTRYYSHRKLQQTIYIKIDSIH